MVTGYINIQDSPYNATGNGSTDDTAAIQAAINASQPGDVILFPRGTYLVSSTIKLLKSRRYVGTHREQVTIKQKNGANLDAVAADEVWLSTSQTVASNPIDIEHIGIDGNGSNQSGGRGIGLALISFWNHVFDLEIQNTRGDGIQLSSARRDGTEVTNTPVESHLSRIDIRYPGGYGIHVYDPTPTNQSVTDGWIKDCIFQNPTLDAIRIDSGAGWEISGCHLYGCQQSGIHVGRADSCRILGNYIESWGYGTVAGYYSAICLGDGMNTWIGSSNPSIIANNTMFFLYVVASGTHIYGISTNCSNSITANVAIVGNALYSNGTQTGVCISNQGSTSVSKITMTGNLINNWSTKQTSNPNGGAITITT